MTCEWNDFIYLAQLNQGLALKSCIEHWRSNWPQTNGTIIWQLNDCWPAVSWSIIDSDLIPKLSYFFVRNVFSPKIITIIKEDEYLKIKLNNHDEGTFQANLKLHIIQQQSGKIIKECDKEFSVHTCQDNVIHKLPIQELNKYGEYILVASVLNKGSELLYRNFYIEQKWKNVKLPVAKLEFDLIEESDLFVSVKTDTPAFFIDLFHPDIDFNDRGFVLLPGETKKIKIIKNNFDQVDTKNIKVYSLNKYLSS